MKNKKVQVETVKVSKLGCMRRSTLVTEEHMGAIEHVEVWVPEDDTEAPSTESPNRDSKLRK